MRFPTNTLVNCELVVMMGTNSQVNLHWITFGSNTLAENCHSLGRECGGKGRPDGRKEVSGEGNG